jgi:hypothetical protein
VETHGFTVNKHVNWDYFNWVAITPKGSIVIFRDRRDYMLYSIYSSARGGYHVHIPYGQDIVTLDKRAEDVLKEVLECLRYARCYIDTTKNMIYNVNRFRVVDFIPFGLVSYTKL